MNRRKVSIVDVIIISPFAWIMAQSALTGQIFWLFLSWWLFNVYTKKRRSWTNV